MGGGGTETTTQTSGLANKQLDTAVSTIGSKLNTALGTGQKVYGESLVPNLSSQTQAGIGALTNNPNNATYGSAISNTMNDFGAIASGQRFGMNDPGYAALRNNVIDDVTTASNATFQGSGRFGSESHRENFNEGLGNALAGMDYANFSNDQQRQMQAAGMLPGLYTASNMPASAQLQAGQIQDTWNTAQVQDKARLFDAQNNAQWNDLSRATGILAASAPSAGTTTSTTTPTAPWWQQMLGAGAIGSGIYKNVWGS